MRHDVSHAALAGFQLAFLSDIHACARFSDTALEALFARVAALDADIVCLGGDLAEDAESLSRLTRFFPLLTPRLGVFACPGNNDHEIDGFSRHVGKYLRLLTNESVRLGGLRLGGVDERKWGRPDARGVSFRRRSRLSRAACALPDLLRFRRGREARSATERPYARAGSSTFWV